MTDPHLQPARLAILGSFAHPDDEQFGTAGALRLCVERGVRVHILSATRGGAGQISDPSLATRDTLAAVRTEELRAAGAILGFEEPRLLDYPDGGVAAVDFGELRDAIVGAIRAIRPAVVVTFDANGGYGHPDHIAVHHATLAAVAAAGDPVHAPHLGPPHVVPKLYATAYPRGRMLRINDTRREHGLEPIDFSSVSATPPAEMGTPPELITTEVPVERVFDLRLRALLAHRTQFGPDSMFARLPRAALLDWLGVDHFRRLHPAPPDGARLPDETDLWAGLPEPDGRSS